MHFQEPTETTCSVDRTLPDRSKQKYLHFVAHRNFIPGLTATTSLPISVAVVRQVPWDCAQLCSLWGHLLPVLKSVSKSVRKKKKNRQLSVSISAVLECQVSVHLCLWQGTNCPLCVITASVTAFRSLAAQLLNMLEKMKFVYETARKN
jgi:hypothetical protein